MKYTPLVIVALLALLSAEERHIMTGVVLKVDPAARSMVVSTDKVAGFMDAMAMPFSVPQAAMLNGLRPGTTIEFTYVVDKGASHAENIRVRGFENLEQKPLELRRLRLLNGLALLRTVPLGNRLYLPENNAATYVDITAACANPTVSPNPAPCSTTTVNFLNTPSPVFVAGIAVDQTHGYVYISESPGTANATIYRFDDSTITAANPGGSAGIVYVTQGRVPAAGTPDAIVYCSLTCTRPADPALTPGGTTGFPFAQGLYVDPNTSKLKPGPVAVTVPR